MKQITIEQAADILTPEAHAYAATLLNAGFRISTSHYPSSRPKSTTYFNAQNADGVCYIESNGYSFKFSTCHKPNRETGTGYQITDGADATPENAAEACKTVIPAGFSRRRQEEPRRTLEETHTMFIKYAVEIVKTTAEPAEESNDAK